MVKISGEFPWRMSPRPACEGRGDWWETRALQRVSVLSAGLDLSRSALWISALTSALRGKIQPSFKQKTVFVISLINILE